MCAEFKKAAEEVKKPFVKLKAQGKWKSWGLIITKHLVSSWTRLYSRRLSDSTEGPPEVRDWVR